MITQTIKRFTGDESGLLSVANAVMMLFFTAVLVCLYNACCSMYDRTESQQRADAIAQSVGNWKARNMNAVTAHHHLMGELLSIVIIHHAVGGEELDSGGIGDTEDADRMLQAAYMGARASDKGTPAYHDIKSKVHAGAALLDGHLKLKELLTQVYVAKTFAIALKAFPPTRPAGEALETAAHLLELEIHREWKVLDQLYRIAKSLSPIKQQILNQYLPDAKKQLDRIIADYPRSQAELVEDLSDRFGVKATVLQSDQRLPVIEDPLARLRQPPVGYVRPIDCDCPTDPADNMRHQIAKVSQLSRATFPWVNYHRKPVVNKLKALAPLSEIGDAYFDHAAGFSKTFADELQDDGELALYTLDDYSGPDKAMEPWTKADGSGCADKSFGVSVLVGSETRTPVGEFFFPATEGDYTYRLATAMVWNRNKPTEPEHRIDLFCKRIVPTTQAKTGWDLLAWKEDANVSELVGIGIPDVFPAIELQWTSNLSPTTAARVKQWRVQPRPDWADRLPEVLPVRINRQFIAL